jgi:hypothetical protein
MSITAKFSERLDTCNYCLDFTQSHVIPVYLLNILNTSVCFIKKINLIQVLPLNFFSESLENMQRGWMKGGLVEGLSWRLLSLVVEIL